MGARWFLTVTLCEYAVACAQPATRLGSVVTAPVSAVALDRSELPPVTTTAVGPARRVQSAPVVADAVREPAPVVPPDALPSVDRALARELGPVGLAKLEVAMSVCGAAVEQYRGALRVGCRACPPFHADTGPDGRVALTQRGGAEFFELEAVYPGSFSKPGSTEIAAVFRGCESHAENWGGTLLAARRGSVWVSIDYRSGFRPLDCQIFRRSDGRDLLVCRWETDHQSSVTWLLDSYDFTLGNAADPEAGWQNLLSLTDNSYSACWGDKTDRIVVGELGAFRVEAAHGERPPRVVAKATLASASQTPGYWSACKQLGSAHAASPHRALKLRTAELVLPWDGSTFTLDASSQSLLHKFLNP